MERDTDVRLEALELLWASLARRVCKLSDQPASDFGRELRAEFDAIRLDQGRSLSDNMREAIKQACRVSRRLDAPDIITD